MLAFAVTTPAVLVLIAGGADYNNAMNMRSKLQSIADSAALAAAKEFTIASATTITVSDRAHAHATSNLKTLSGALVQASASLAPAVVQVNISIDVASYLGAISPLGAVSVNVLAKAGIKAGTATCLLGLDTVLPSTLALDAATIQANGCAVYSDSKSSSGMALSGGGSIAAGMICSAGGASGGASAYAPIAITDCPILKDPLLERLPPGVGPCTATGKIISGGTVTLTPGTYCGGLKITASAIVTLNPGIYIIKDGPLTVESQSKLTGNNAGFYLTGAGALLAIDDTTTISMQAPASGSMAGMLFFEDRAALSGQSHMMGSRNAPELLGTFYFPQNKLVIGYTPTTAGTAVMNCTLVANFPGQCPPKAATVASSSAWTIVIARQVVINAGIKMVLNSNYAGSSIPPPPEVALPVASLLY